LVDPIFVSKTDELAEILPSLLVANDVVLTLGAGNVGAVAVELPHTLALKLAAAGSVVGE
jgi:UDP-N-acetylmuramate--alanine ligase